MEREELTNRERIIIFDGRGYDYRMNVLTPEEQHDNAGIPRYWDELGEDDKVLLEKYN